MKRADAFALVTKHGRKPRKGITKDTRVLIVGGLGWPLQDDGRPSNSLATAKSYGIPIVSERQFLEWVVKSSPEKADEDLFGRPDRCPEQTTSGNYRATVDVWLDRG
jgi:hypothetical protein